MKLSDTGRDLIKHFEGLELESYQDGGGVWTIGYGHTSGVEEGQTVSKVEADRLLAADVEWAEEAVQDLVTVELWQQQFDSLVSFVFNLGESQFRNSTLLKVLNSGDYLGVPQELAKWNKDNGVRILGLLKRRLAEANQWIT